MEGYIHPIDAALAYLSAAPKFEQPLVRGAWRAARRGTERDVTPDATGRPAPEQSGNTLIDRDRSSAERLDSGGMRAAVSNAMVSLKKEYYGKGPTSAKTYVNDNYIFCVLEGGLTRNEETLLAAGEERLVREYRLRFQEAMRESTMKAVEEITGCRVTGYHSQIVFDPEYAFEIFVLDQPPRR
jgi:uncharacterized protein YbcI